MQMHSIKPKGKLSESCVNFFCSTAAPSLFIGYQHSWHPLLPGSLGFTITNVGRIWHINIEVAQETGLL